MEGQGNLRLGVLLFLLLIIGFAHTAKPKAPRILATNVFRLWVEYTDADAEWKNNTQYSAKYIFSKKVVEVSRRFFTNILSVVSRKETYTWADFQTSDSKTVKGRTTPYDLWVYFRVFTKNDGTLAQAAPVAYDTPSNRPIAGFFELNIANTPTMNLRGAISSLATFVHEFYHIIVFHSDSYEKFVDSSNTLVGKANLIGTVTLGGKTRTTYKGKAVLAWAKAHLNFNSLSYIVMENDGGSGSAASHWEHKYWSTEFMAPADVTPVVLSGMSLSMAVDSGWYTINSNLVEELKYGKNAGIDIQTDACPTVNIAGFCTTLNDVACGPDWKFKGKCSSDVTYSEGCNFLTAEVMCWVPDADYGSAQDSTYDNLGDGSRCVMTTPQGQSAKPICAKTSCTGTTAITYTFKNGKTCTCTAGSAVSCTDATVSVTCPSTTDIAALCTSLQDANRCPADCNGKGVCFGPNGSKTCFCMYGWTGSDCNTVSTTETDAAIGSTVTGGGTVNSGTTSTGASANQISIVVTTLLVLNLAMII